MGQATGDLVKELGGTVTMMDVKDPLGVHDRFIQLDLVDKASINAALEQLDGPIDALFLCAGVSGGPVLPQINFIGQRHLLESADDRGLLPQGAAVAMIASIGGMGWERELDAINEVLDIPDYQAAVKWIEANPERNDYRFFKQTTIVYCARRAPELMRRGIRINATAPGPTLTPLMAANEGWQGSEAAFQATMGRGGSSPAEQAYPLVFLASEAASFVSGTCLIVDAGFVGGGMTGVLDGPMVDALLKRGAQPSNDSQVLDHKYLTSKFTSRYRPSEFTD
jgi:NAD(P)-dependent dehydrogenase (short-subunit alcohol dehydrogenase family)